MNDSIFHIAVSGTLNLLRGWSLDTEVLTVFMLNALSLVAG